MELNELLDEMKGFLKVLVRIVRLELENQFSRSDCVVGGNRLHGTQWLQRADQADDLNYVTVLGYLGINLWFEVSSRSNQ